MVINVKIQVIIYFLGNNLILSNHHVNLLDYLSQIYYFAHNFEPLSHQSFILRLSFPHVNKFLFTFQVWTFLSQIYFPFICSNLKLYWILVGVSNVSFPLLINMSLLLFQDTNYVVHMGHIAYFSYLSI